MSKNTFIENFKKRSQEINTFMYFGNIYRFILHLRQECISLITMVTAI